MKADMRPRPPARLTRSQETLLWLIAVGVFAVFFGWWGTVVYLLAVAP